MLGCSMGFIVAAFLLALGEPFFFDRAVDRVEERQKRGRLVERLLVGDLLAEFLPPDLFEFLQCFL